MVCLEWVVSTRAAASCGNGQLMLSGQDAWASERSEHRNGVLNDESFSQGKAKPQGPLALSSPMILEWLSHAFLSECLS